VVEWLKAPASKAGERDERSESSNLSLSEANKAVDKRFALKPRVANASRLPSSLASIDQHVDRSIASIPQILRSASFRCLLDA
jgi:hypothetical protein